MNTRTIITFLVITVGVMLGVGGLLWNFGQQEEKPIAEIAGEMRYKEGSGNIILVEFSDFQCPACRAVQEPLTAILLKYQDKITMVYRHFPLSNIHKNAQIAARATEAAYQQGKFWEMHDLLFEKQTEWAELTDPREKLSEYAGEIGMEKEKFVSDLESDQTKQVVANDLLAATRYRLTGTPTFFVNGIKTEFTQLEARIAELTKE